MTLLNGCSTPAPSFSRTTCSRAKCLTGSWPSLVSTSSNSSATDSPALATRIARFPRWCGRAVVCSLATHFLARYPRVSAAASTAARRRVCRSKGHLVRSPRPRLIIDLMLCWDLLYRCWKNIIYLRILYIFLFIIMSNMINISILLNKGYNVINTNTPLRKRFQLEFISNYFNENSNWVANFDDDIHELYEWYLHG